VHVKAVSNGDPWSFWGDEVYIINFNGSIVGHFWFRDLAMMICGSSLYTWKNWKYFDTYFLALNMVQFTRKRFIMAFPKNSPIGCRVMNELTYFYVHPDYEPTSKIRASVIAYNFVTDNINVGKSAAEYKKKKEAGENVSGVYVYKLTDVKVHKNDQFHLDPGENTDPFLAFGFGGVLMPFFTENLKPNDCKLLECFECVAEMPLAHLTNQIDGEFSEMYARPTHDTLNINWAQAEIWGIGMRFSYAMPTPQPARIYHSTDSEVMSFWLDASNFDNDVEESYEKSAIVQLMDYFAEVGQGEVVSYLGMIRKLAGEESTGYGRNKNMRVWWRYGPHTYMIYQAAPGIGIVVFPITFYEYSWYFLDNQCINKTAEGAVTPVNSNGILTYGGRMVCLDTSDAKKINDNLYYVFNSGHMLKIKLENDDTELEEVSGIIQKLESLSSADLEFA
jgi:hypothetical protein